MVYIGYDPYLCTDCHYSNALRIFEIVDGRLVEVCKGCAKWLCEEGYVEDLEVWDGDFDSYIDIAFDNLDG